MSAAKPVPAISVRHDSKSTLVTATIKTRGLNVSYTTSTFVSDVKAATALAKAGALRLYDQALAALEKEVTS